MFTVHRTPVTQPFVMSLLVLCLAGVYVKEGSRTPGSVGLEPGDRILAVDKTGMLAVTKVILALLQTRDCRYVCVCVCVRLCRFVLCLCVECVESASRACLFLHV